MAGSWRSESAAAGRAALLFLACLWSGPGAAQGPSPMSAVPGAGVAETPTGATAGQVLRFAVAVPSGPPWSGLRVEVDRLGRSTVLGLVDDGSTPGDIPLDGVYVGSQSGLYARYVTLRLYGRSAAGTESLLWEGTVATPDQWQETIAFRLAPLDFSEGASQHAPRSRWPPRRRWGTYRVCFTVHVRCG